jgi:putative component of toxin-antitoxin plasmid stabilization module
MAMSATGSTPNEIILLGGGDKSTQTSDIRKAKECWGDYNA